MRNSLMLLLALLLMAGCSNRTGRLTEDDDDSADDDDDVTGDDDDDVTGDDDDDDDDAPEGLGFVGDFDLGGAPRALTSGTRTYDFDFGAEAEANGYSDCSFTYEYTNGKEDRTLSHLCPDCDAVFEVNVDLVDGQACHDIFFYTGVPAKQWIGWNADTVFHGFDKHYQLWDEGEATHSTDAVSGSYNYTDPTGESGFTYELTSSYAYTYDASVDPWGDYAPLEANAKTECGWPRSGAENYTGDGILAVGEVLPDATLVDICDDGIRLHDFKGKYTVFMGKASDCPPCQSMAQGEPGFVDSMSAAGVDVNAVTIFTPSLSDPLGHSPDFLINGWVDTFDLHSPVLADRGYAYWVFGEAGGPQSGFPYWVLVDPDMNVLDFGSGYSPAVFTSMENQILADMGN